jgi:hypothetical protein
MKKKSQQVTIDFSQGLSDQVIQSIEQSLSTLGLPQDKVTKVVQPLKDALKEQQQQMTTMETQTTTTQQTGLLPMRPTMQPPVASKTRVKAVWKDVPEDEEVDVLLGTEDEDKKKKNKKKKC